MARAARQLGNSIVQVVGTDPEHLEVTLMFDDGVTETISLRSIFEPPTGLADEVLRGNVFGSCFVESGALARPNGLELCPDALRLKQY